MRELDRAPLLFHQDLSKRKYNAANMKVDRDRHDIHPSVKLYPILCYCAPYCQSKLSIRSRKNY